MTNPTLDVGDISEFYRGRVGINPNCDANGCYEDLEKARWDEIKIGVPASATSLIGSVTYNPSDQLKDWYLDFLREDRSTLGCDNTYDAYFECESYAIKQHCYDLKAARDYYNANNPFARQDTTGDWEDGLGVSSCIPDSDTGQVEAPDANVASQYLAIEQERVDCYNNIYRYIIDFFDRSWLEASIVDTANSRVVVGGNESLIGGFYTSRIAEDSTIRQMAYQIAINAASSTVPGQNLVALQQLIAQYNIDVEVLYVVLRFYLDYHSNHNINHRTLT